MRTIKYITWLNYLGGFQYFPFKGNSEYQVDVEATGETTRNIFPNWPKSYGEYADTITKQTFRDTRNAILLKSQHLTFNQVNALAAIRTSPLVQLMVTRSDKRTVLVDYDSFKIYDEGESLYTMQFRVRFTNKNPSQRL